MRPTIHNGQGGGKRMTYACEDCGFLFYRTGEVEKCPSCEKTNIRFATQEEAQRLQEFMEKGNCYLS